jgi:hypothetical protein
MDELDEVLHVVWGLVSVMIRGQSMPVEDTRCLDKDGTRIKTGDVLETWLTPDGTFHSEEPSEELKPVREVLVVHAREGKVSAVDYDILRGIDLHEIAAECTVRGSAMDEEGLEYLRMGLGRFNGVGVDDE